MDIHCLVARGKWTGISISLANLGRLARSLIKLWVLSMARVDDKAMLTLETL